MYIKKQYDKIKIDDKITLTGNETVVENVNRMIEHIQNHKILVGKAKKVFSAKSIKELNGVVVKPLDIISTRPAQKTYPNINGLYLLLRTMGILRFKVSKKEVVVEINQKLLKNWQKLNSTEQYFMLLEFWLIHSTPEDTINAFESSSLGSIINFFLEKRFELDDTLSELTYYPEYYNISLCEMFGFVTIFSMSPKEKNRWNIVDVKVNPLVKQILPLIMMQKREILGFLLFNQPKIGFTQKIFHPYFKEYKKVLKYQKDTSTKEGVFRLKVSLGRVYRTLEMDADSTFQSLASDILDEFNFDNDHLYEFRFSDNFGKDRTIKHPYIREEGVNDLWADEYLLKNFPLKELESFKFIFDFGDWWEFDILIEKIDESRKIEETKVVKSHGEAPKQYEYYDEDFDDE